MRIFQFIFLIPTLLCTTVAFAAPACWEIKNACNDKNSCVLSAKTIDEHSVTTKYYFRCGGQDGCKPQTITRSNADMPTMYTYNECTSNGWKQIPDIKSYIQANINKIRNCGDNEASTKNVGYIVEAREISDEYDFIMEQHKTYALNSDICKKPKSDKVEKPQKTQTNTEKSAPVVKPDVTDTPTGTKNDAPQQVEQPVEKDAPKPAQVQNNITISGTVFDNKNSPIPQVNIVVVGNETYGVAADDNGRYTINGLSADSKLKFSSIGFKPVEKTVANLNDNPNVELTETAVGLREVTISPCADDEKFEHGKCVKTKSADEEKEEKTIEPTYEQKISTDETSYTPSADELAQKLKSAKDALAAAKEKENSLANKSLSAISTAATSLGAMQLAEGIAEKKADEEAEKEMRNYISTMKCEYGGGKHVDFGVEETLPGGNELLEYYTEYKTLADNLKTTKAALGLSAGIESEVLYDRAQSGLYQYASTGKTGGGETSLFRALTDAESTDATAWTAQKKETNQKLTAGGLATAGGVATGVIGNAIINRDTDKSTTTNSHTTRSKKTSIDDNTEYTQEAEQIILKERKRNDQCDDEECQKFSKCTDSGGMWKDGNCDCNGTLIEPTGDGITCKCKYQDKGVVLVEYMLGGSCECKTGTFWSASETRCLNKSEANKNETYCDERFGRWIKSKNECLDHVSEGYHQDDCKYSGGEYDYDNDACKCDKDKFLTNSEKNAFECECNDGLKWNKRQEKCVKPVLNTLKEAFNKKQRDNTAPQKTTKDDFDLVMNPINKKANYK